MSESEQRASGNKVGGSVLQRTDAERAKQIVEGSEIAGSLTQESLRTKKDGIEDILKQVLATIDYFGLSEDDKADLKSQAETVQAQMRAKAPKPTIVTESLKSIWETLKGAATSGAGLLAKDLMDRIAGFLR